jgi:hypothetical protein
MPHDFEDIGFNTIGAANDEDLPTRTVWIGAAILKSTTGTAFSFATVA